MTSGEMRAEWDAELRRKAAAAARDLDQPVPTPAPTDPERVGAELVRHLDHDHGEADWRIDIIDRDQVETIVSLTPGQAMMVRAQMDVAIRAELKIREAGTEQGT